MEFTSIEEKAEFYLKQIEKDDKKGKKINAFLELNPDLMEEASELDVKKKTGKKLGRLFGKIIGVKSNINVLGMTASCASRTLENYKSTYDAIVISKIKAEDGLIIGMCNCDEFASGSSGENSAFGATKNPRALTRIPGGSSSGSVAAVAAGFCDLSLGSDTGGSIRNPSSFCGVVGVKPSYGLVSRYGLIDLSMSLDQIGVIGNNVEDCALLLDVIRGKDERDTKSFESKKIEIGKIEKIDKKKLRVGVLKVNGVDNEIQKVIDNKVKELKEKWKCEIIDLEIKYIDLAVQTYYPLVYTEFFSGTRRFDGRKYGKKIEESCGEEVLRRILGGSEITKAEFEGAYYRKALDVKELIKEEFEFAFEDVDCILSPVVPGMPWEIGKGKEMKPEEIYAYDALTIPANLAEICAVSVPIGTVKDGNSDIPVGLQIMCAKNEESKMFGIAREVAGLGVCVNGTSSEES